MPGKARASLPLTIRMFEASMVGFLAVFLDADFARAFVAAPALHEFDFVLLEQKFDALGVLLDDFVFAAHDVGPIHFQAADFKSQLRAILEMIVNVGVVQQNFGGNTANVQAGAAEKRIFFDYDSLQVQVRRRESRLHSRPARYR